MLAAAREMERLYAGDVSARGIAVASGAPPAVGAGAAARRLKVVGVETRAPAAADEG